MKSRLSFHPLIALAILVLPLLGSCRALSTTVEVTVRPQEKDVLLCFVHLTRALRPREYVAWTEEDLLRTGHDPENPFFPGTPVYQMKYVFFEGNQHLASVYYQRDESGENGPQLLYQRARIHAEEKRKR